MNQKSKNARTKLRKATRTEFEKLVYEAMLTPVQESIIRLHIAQGVAVGYIAMRMSMSEACVRKHLCEAYEKVAKV
jgi:DNA-binding NarL/FixJ family response regulator